MSDIEEELLAVSPAVMDKESESESENESDSESENVGSDIFPLLENAGLKILQLIMDKDMQRILFTNNNTAYAAHKIHDFFSFQNSFRSRYVEHVSL